MTLVSVGTAFASDVNDTDLTQISDVDDAIAVDSQDDELSSDGTFNDLNTLIQNASSGDTISLEKDYLFNSTVDADYSMGIVIDKALTIDGAGYTIDANSSARIFNVTADNVIIKNVVFTNGYCKEGTGQAGCVLWSGDNGQLINSTFTDSYAKIGGAVLWYGIDGLIDECNFTSNEAMSTAGAIYWNSTGGNINNSYFSKNHVTTKGGAIYSSYNDDLNITNCDFYTNYASLGAGAVAFDYVSANLVNCSFENNYAGLSYGVFTIYYNGGAVYLTGNESNLVNLFGCTFEGNDAGAGSSIVGTSLYTACPVNISDSTFTDSSNSKTIAATSEIYLSGNVLNNNNNVYVNGGEVTSPITVVILNGSSIEASVGDEITLSGVIYDDNNNSIILNSIDFVVNDDEAVSATFDSYGVFTADYTISDDGSYTISANTTDKLADATILPASVTTDKIANNTFTVLASLIANVSSGDTLTLAQDYQYNSNVDSNFSMGIVIDKALTINGNGFTISGNGSHKIFNVNVTGGVVTLNNITFVDSVGAVYTGSELIVNDCAFIDNNYNYGVNRWGAIYSNGNLTIANSKFVNNTAMNGGAIYIEGCNAIISGSEFINNTAAGDGESGGEGGAICTLLSNILNIDNCVFTANTATPADPLAVGLWMSDGGAVSTSANTVINNSKFSNNNASCGGAVSMVLGYVVISNSSFTDNNAIYGGAIWDDSNNVTIGCSTFDGNKATNVSGAIYNDCESTLTIIDCIFAGNEADKACAVYNELMGEVSGDLTIINSTFTDNGGADNYSIYNEGTLSLSGNSVDNIIYSNATIISTTNVVVLENKTVEAEYGDTVTLNATYTDDNGNLIEDPNFKFSVDGVKDLIDAYYENGLYTADYKVNVTGKRVVSADLGYAVTVNPGLLETTKTNVTQFTMVVGKDSNKISYGENATVFVTLIGIDGIGLNVTDFVIVVNNMEYAVDINGGEGSFNVSGLNPGDYAAIGIFEGDDFYNKAYATGLFEVLVDPEITIGDIKGNYGETVEVNVTIAGGDATGYILFDNSLYNVKDGQATVPLTISKVGVQSIEVYYLGDDKYNNGTATKEFNAGKSNSTIFITNYPSPINVGDDAIVEFEIDRDVWDNMVTLWIDGNELITFNIDHTEGYYLITGNNFPEEGTYNITVQFKGNSRYNASNNASCLISVVNDTPVVQKVSEFSDIIIYGDYSISVVLKDEDGKVVSNATISYVINGTNYTTTTDSAGAFTIQAANNCTVDISFDGNGDLLAVNTSITLKDLVPARTATSINAEDYTTYAIDFYAGERGNYFKVQLVDANGNPLVNKSVKIGFNGKVYNRTTNGTGWVELQINLKKAGTYTFAIAFLGDENYNASFTVKKIIVNKKTTSISASAKTFKASAKTKSYTVTLKTIAGSSVDGKSYMSSGKKVTLKINGKTYTGKTNSEGQVTFKLSITKKGKFVTVIKFAGDTTYASTSKSVIITIK